MGAARSSRRGGRPARCWAFPRSSPPLRAGFPFGEPLPQFCSALPCESSPMTRSSAGSGEPRPTDGLDSIASHHEAPPRGSPSQLSHEHAARAHRGA